MKKGQFILLSLFTLSLFLILGIFIGRNLTGPYQKLPKSDPADNTVTTGSVEDYLLNINSATKAQFMSLPGIGETIADRIIAYRTQVGTFHSVDELLEVEGIGEKKLLEIEKLITVGG